MYELTSDTRRLGSNGSDPSPAARTRRDLLASVVADSRAMRRTVDLLSRAAGYPAPLLILGEPGSGKSLLAELVHRLSGAPGQPVVLPCGSLPAELLEAELFGSTPGSSRVFAEGHRGLLRGTSGTVVLDDAHELPPALQARLGAVLAPARGGSVRVIVVAPHAPENWAPPADADFVASLSALRVTMPPLRERREDIPALAARIAAECAEQLGRPVRFTPAALASLSARAWPGNARELRLAIERAATLSATGLIDEEELGSPAATMGAVQPGVPTYQLKPQVEALERVVIRRALEAANGSRREAARLLGVSLRTLFYKLRRYQIS